MRREMDNLTKLVLDGIAARDFTNVVVHVRNASAARTRPALIAAAMTEAVPHGNLAQALAAVGGASVKTVLRDVVLRCLSDPTILAGEETALHAVSNAAALLQLAPSRLAAKLAVEGLSSDHQTVRAASARSISHALLRQPTVAVQHILEATLPRLLSGDPLTFVNAIPILVLRRRADVERRWRDERPSFDLDVRRVGASVVSKLPLVFGLRLALVAFYADSDLTVRLSLANVLLEALSAADLRRVIEEGLEAPEPELRLSAAELLLRSPKLAESVVARTDPDPEVESVLKGCWKAKF